MTNQSTSAGKAVGFYCRGYSPKKVPPLPSSPVGIFFAPSEPKLGQSERALPEGPPWTPVACEQPHVHKTVAPIRGQQWISPSNLKSSDSSKSRSKRATSQTPKPLSRRQLPYTAKWPLPNSMMRRLMQWTKQKPNSSAAVARIGRRSPRNCGAEHLTRIDPSIDAVKRGEFREWPEAAAELRKKYLE